MVAELKAMKYKLKDLEEVPVEALPNGVAELGTMKYKLKVIKSCQLQS